MAAAGSDAIFAGCLIVIVTLTFTSGINDCIFRDVASGKQYDLRPLIATNGSYKWTQAAFMNSAGSMLVSALEPIQDTLQIEFQLQICRDVLIQTLPKQCNETGAIHTWNARTNTCTSWGRSDVSLFSLNPYKDGIFLQMFGGSPVNHWYKYSSNIYFVCRPNVTMTPPEFELVKADINQAHFKIYTKYVC